MLRTNIELDEKMVGQALKLTHMRTKKELVNYAIKEIVSREKRKKLLEVEGKITWKGNLELVRQSRA